MLQQLRLTLLLRLALKELTEQHFKIHYGATGHSYETIFSPYLVGAKSIEIEAPYIRVTHQIQKNLRFFEAVIKIPIIRKISLITSYDEETDVKEISEHLAAIWMMAIYPLTITGQRTQCVPGHWAVRTGCLQVRCAAASERRIS